MNRHTFNASCKGKKKVGVNSQKLEILDERANFRQKLELIFT